MAYSTPVIEKQSVRFSKVSKAKIEISGPNDRTIGMSVSHEIQRARAQSSPTSMTKKPPIRIPQVLHVWLKSEL